MTDPKQPNQQQGLPDDAGNGMSDRAGYYEQGQFASEYGSPLCLVKLGCWGPVVKCNVPKRGWMNGVGGCPNVGGICIGCSAQ